MQYYGWVVIDAGVFLYPGTVVTISNCVMSPLAATIIAIGSGCPSNAATFQCMAIASTGCTTGASLTFTVVTGSRFLYM